MTRSLIVAARRTPVGKLNGALSSLAASDLGGVAVRALLTDTGVDPTRVDAVIMGQVLTAGVGQIPARQAAVAAGIPMTTHATTLNKVCLSGLAALRYGDLLVRSGEADVVVVGGMESMSRAPYLLPGARQGFRFGDVVALDSMTHDGLTCAFDHCAMGAATETHAGGRISRARQDEFAARSHSLALAARSRGAFDPELSPVTVTSRRGDSREESLDEGVRADTSLESLGTLRPAFDSDGTITAGNASQISDGAAALLLVSESFATQHDLRPLGELVAYGEVAGPDTSLLHQPSRAIRAALAKTDLRLDDLRHVEINEAFAAVALASLDDLGVDPTLVNPDGGAIALGHPIGASGARLAVHALHALEPGSYAAVALCGGGGQGDGAILRRL